jgi:hypothetical protein
MGTRSTFLLSATRDAAAAERFLAKALGREDHTAPRVINTDKHARLSSSYYQAPKHRGVGRKLSSSACPISEQYFGAGSPGYQTPVPDKPMVSFLLERPAYDRRLRGNSHDSRKGQAAWNKGAGSLNHFIVSLFAVGV